MRGFKTILSEFKKIEIISSICFSKHKALRLQIDCKNITAKKHRDMRSLKQHVTKQPKDH